MTGQLRYEASGLARSARVDLASGEGTGYPQNSSFPTKSAWKPVHPLALAWQRPEMNGAGRFLMPWDSMRVISD